MNARYGGGRNKCCIAQGIWTKNVELRCNISIFENIDVGSSILAKSF